MADPKLKTTRVDVCYSADDGFSSEAGFRGTKERPELGLLAALEELARLTALFGFEDEALEVFNGARKRVATWKASRPASAAQLTLKPCRSPYCECAVGQCSHPGFYDARHENLPNA